MTIKNITNHDDKRYIYKKYVEPIIWMILFYKTKKSNAPINNKYSDRYVELPEFEKKRKSPLSAYYGQILHIMNIQYKFTKKWIFITVVHHKHNDKNYKTEFRIGDNGKFKVVT